MHGHPLQRCTLREALEQRAEHVAPPLAPLAAQLRRLRLGDCGVVERARRTLHRRSAEDARRAETDRRMDRSSIENWRAVGADGLSIFDRLADVAFEHEELGTVWPSAAARRSAAPP